MRTAPLAADTHHRRIRLELETVRSLSQDAGASADAAAAAKTARCPSYGKKC